MQKEINVRGWVVRGIILVACLVLIGKLFSMQVLNDQYASMSRDISVRQTSVYPARGLLYDRNGKLVVSNEAVYDVLMIPREVKNLDTTKLMRLLDMDKQDFVKRVAELKSRPGRYSTYKPNVLFKQISSLVYARLQEYLYQFPGIYTQVRTIRNYPYPYAAHIFGYIGEIGQTQLDSSEYYKLGDYIGISGIEKVYENKLRGERGVEYVVVDIHNREKERYNQGKLDKPAIAGIDLVTTIDIELQRYAEELLSNKLGSVVAIEPTTGEILALVSSPTYNPNMLSGRVRGKGMDLLQADTNKPLFNRAIYSKYPPGSTFKPVMGLLALQDNLIKPNYYYGCNYGYYINGLRVGCHDHKSASNIMDAVKHSCNAYFCHLFQLFIDQDGYPTKAASLAQWKNYLTEFGFNTDLHLDLPIIEMGYIPGPERYNRMYGENRWGASTIISLGIGQGEMGASPLQLAHATAIIANRGQYYYPHIIRTNPSDTASIYNKAQQVSIDRKHFEPIVDGMRRVVLDGTARIAAIDSITICGKTGTAENPHGEDHSLFISFAPMHQSKIAVAVMVENAGYGSTYAAPIASLIIEKYLNGKISDKRKWIEKRMLDANILPNTEVSDAIQQAPNL